MRLKSIEIENFRRIEKAVLNLEPATFVVGPNNFGKSSILVAIEALTSVSNKIESADHRENSEGERADKVVITGTFGPVSPEVAASRGFKGRVVDNLVRYRKTWRLGNAKPKIEMQTFPSVTKEEFLTAKIASDLVDAGLDESVVRAGLELEDLGKKLPKDWTLKLPETQDFDKSVEAEWVENPGGIPQNIISKLPRVIHIPASTERKDIESSEKKHILGECLSLLFEDLLENSKLTDEIKGKLAELQDEMSPARDESVLSTLITEVNKIICDVFPGCGIDIDPSLNELIAVLKPKYAVNLISNVKTDIGRQGDGLIRTTAFAMLRYHAKLKLEKKLDTRPVIVAFEEPELYLHPSAGNLLRDAIYALGQSDQIVCTTHSPWMIDLTRGTQSLSRAVPNLSDGHSVSAENYPVSDILDRMDEDDKRRLKMLMAFDDQVSRVFFSEKILVVEGDSEIIAIRNTLRLLPDEVRNKILADFTFVNARGKGSLLAVVRYLRSLDLRMNVMHDLDTGVEGAMVFNDPINKAHAGFGELVALDRFLEDVLGYDPPSSDKPFKAYKVTKAWGSIDDVPESWLTVLAKVLETNLLPSKKTGSSKSV